MTSIRGRQISLFMSMAIFLGSLNKIHGAMCYICIIKENFYLGFYKTLNIIGRYGDQVPSHNFLQKYSDAAGSQFEIVRVPLSPRQPRKHMSNSN